MLKLYGAAPTRGIRAMWLLNELGLDYETVSLNVLKAENRTPEFLALNPAAKLPVLVDGETVITESVAIQLYLAEKYPDAGFIPASLEVRAQMYRWILFLVTEIEQPLWRIARHKFIYAPTLRLPQDVELARHEALEMIAVLEQHMQHREFMVGERISVADFTAAFTLDWANEVGLVEDAPHLGDYLQRLYERPAAPPRIAAALAATRQ